MNVIEIKNISKKYFDKNILDSINLNIFEGEIFGLIGLNGIGKTTLIKIILNLIVSDSGDVLINNNNVKFSISRDNIRYLPEKFQPPQNLTTREFLTLFANLKKEDSEKLENLCNKLFFDSKNLDKRISNLSKGMTQKIGLIATVLENKKIIILDEPMSGLDPVARIYLKRLLLDYKKQGNTVFFSSHILSDLDEICDRIAVLHDTKIKFVGSPNAFKYKNSQDSLEKAFLVEIE